jgi:GMP synthase-like glutamine amidotransferase
MKPIRIFRHLMCQHPGYLGEYLLQRGIPWEMVCIDEGRPVEKRVDDVSGLIFMGAGVSVNDKLSWINSELELIRKAYQRDIPMLGVCFGAQIMSRALGGQVFRGDGMEIGWHPVMGVVENDLDGWLSGLPKHFTVFQWHADTFTLPEGSQLLMRSDCYSHQAFAIGNHLGLQFHLEMTCEMVNNWIKRYGSDLEHPSSCLQSGALILKDLEQRISQLHKISFVLYGNWLERVLRRQQL